MEKAVVIFSGGLDSTTLLYSAREQGYEPIALTFEYGQKHKKETNFAKRTTDFLHIMHHVLDMNVLQSILSSALTSEDIAIPIVPDREHKPASLKSTVVPFRNGIFLSVAVGLAESIKANTIFYGAHASDHGVYPDCRPVFVDAFKNAAQIGTGNMELKIIAPFANMTKAKVVSLGAKLGVPFEETWSCYKGELVHCGECGSCVERKWSFEKAGIKDPTSYKLAQPNRTTSS